jgi:hypothetical protein
MQPGVLPSPTPEFLDDAVVRDGLADQRRSSALVRVHTRSEGQASQCIAKKATGLTSDVSVFRIDEELLRLRHSDQMK